MGGFRELPREVKILTVVAFTVAVGFGIQSPAIPVFAGEFGVGSTAIGAVVSAFAFMRLATGLPGGRLVNRFGERRVLLTGMAMLAATSILAGLSWNYPLLLIFRGACGVGSALYTVSAMNMLLRVTPASHRGRATGYFQGGYYLGTVTGPALGGGLLGVSPRLPFFVYGVAVAVAGAIAAVALARAALVAPAAPRAEAAPQGVTLGQALRQRPYLAALSSNFALGWAVFGVRVSVLPLYLLVVIKASPTWIGAGLAVGAVVQAAALPLAGRMADLWGRRPSLLLGQGLILCCLAMVTAWQTLPSYLAAFALIGLGTAFCTTGGAATVGDVTQGRGGTVVAGYQMTADLGMTVGPLVAGALAAAYSYEVAFMGTAAVVLVGWLMALTVPPRPTERPA
ncbi:putative transporter [Sphaerisporangium krabiense]|uniref:MFS family permease n=1 Tax=Sphaerisporangium krabiense TaxID=763782 RepID=A0A7W8Z2I4_9ACTN|nr:MFS transporter [Sphaerisporangium krabiense]MBB5626162.1 MFS family permease [Sphaerisporangium krabiense]GII66171.1 putative transporter [Sphaerisporangium krabiense]